MLAALLASHRPPMAFAEYQLESLLGEGETGEVWAARDTVLERRVAIKFLRGAALEGARRGRFAVEARALARLRHPNVVAIHRAGEIEGRPYLVSELVEGTSLAEVPRPVPAARLLEWGLCLADALRAAHREGVLHRDIKPANVMLTPAGEVKLVDFGLAKLAGSATVESSAPRGEPPGPSVTRTGALLGTPLYLPPEAWEQAPATPQSDLYSLGVLLYELACGHTPFAATTLEELCRSATTSEAPPLPREVPSTSTATGTGRPGDALFAVIERCLRRQPAERFASAAELYDALAALARSAGADEARPGPVADTARPPRRGRAAAGAALALVLVALIVGAAGSAAWLRHRAAASAEAPSRAVDGTTRRSVALLGFEASGARAEDAWIGPALTDALASELSLPGMGASLRVIHGEEVAAMRRDLASELPGAGGVPSPAGSERMARYLGADALLFGSFSLEDAAGPGGGGGRALHVTWRLADARSGRLSDAQQASGRDDGTDSQLFAVVARTGARIRESLGAGPVSAAEHEALRAALPADAEAQRLYAQGMVLVEQHEMLAARDLLVRAAEKSPRSPLIHSALLQVASRLGPITWARDEARVAFELSSGLPRADQLRSEAAFDRINHRFDHAAELYRALLRFYPESLLDGLELSQCLHAGGHVDEAMTVLADLRRLPPPLGDDARIDLAAEFYLRMAGRMAEALESSRRAEATGRARGNRYVIGRARLVAGFALLHLGRLPEAEAAFVEAAPLLSAIGEWQNEVWARDGVARLRLRRGQVSAAVRECDAILERTRTLYSTQMEIAMAASCATPLRAAGQLVRARTLADRALEMCRAGQGVDCLAEASSSVAAAQLLAGEPAAALATLDAVLAQRPEVAATAEGARLSLLRGEALLRAGSLSAARSAIEATVRLADKLTMLRFAQEGRALLGEVALGEGHLANAEAAFREAAERYGTEGAIDDQLTALSRLAEAQSRRRQHAEARDTITTVEALARRSEHRVARATALCTSARVLGRAHRPEDAARIGQVRAALEAVLSEAKADGYAAVQRDAGQALAGLKH